MIPSLCPMNLISLLTWHLASGQKIDLWHMCQNCFSSFFFLSWLTEYSFSPFSHSSFVYAASGPKVWAAEFSSKQHSLHGLDGLFLPKFPFLSFCAWFDLILLRMGFNYDVVATMREGQTNPPCPTSPPLYIELVRLKWGLLHRCPFPKNISSAIYVQDMLYNPGSTTWHV